MIERRWMLRTDATVNCSQLRLKTWQISEKDRLPNALSSLCIASALHFAMQLCIAFEYLRCSCIAFVWQLTSDYISFLCAWSDLDRRTFVCDSSLRLVGRIAHGQKTAASQARRNAPAARQGRSKYAHRARILSKAG
mgnify:CR=1 FL=1